MKYDDAEKVMAKLEEVYPEKLVEVLSRPPASSKVRTYAVKVNLGVDAGLEMLTALTGIADAAGAEIAVGPSATPTPSLAAIFD